MQSSFKMSCSILAAALSVALAASAQAQVVKEYGDEDLCNTGTYSSDPKAGATLYGLAPGVTTLGNRSFGHGFPFAPTANDYSGTDQIYVGSTQTAGHDGYSGYSGRRNGPQVFALDYSSLVPAGQTIQTLTLGIGADDFQFPSFGQGYTASINGTTNSALTTALNALNQTGPVAQFLTIGIDPALLNGNNILNLSINQGGDGGDGWAVDFLTIGVTTRPSSVPEPGSIALLVAGGLVGSRLLLRRRKEPAA